MTAPSRRARGRSPPDRPILTSHQRFIRALPCVACGKPAPSECAQIGVFAGIGLPTGNRYLIPLCGPPTVWQDCCHSRKHYLGPTRFWSALGIDPIEVAARLWPLSGDVKAGEFAVWRARQVAFARRENSRRREGAGWRDRNHMPLRSGPAGNAQASGGLARPLEAVP